MMSDTRFKNALWKINSNADGTIPTTEAHLALLMDIRDELQKLNGVLSCPQFRSIPHKLEAIRRNTAKRRKVRIPHA
jgi:hypothetical protein